MIRNEKLISRYLGTKVTERIKERSGVANYRLLISMLDDTADDIASAEQGLNRLSKYMEQVAERMRESTGEHPRQLNPLGEVQAMGPEIDVTIARQQAAVIGLKRIARILCDGE